MRLFNTVMKSPGLHFLFIYKGNRQTAAQPDATNIIIKNRSKAMKAAHNDYATHSDYIGQQNGALSYDVTAAILVFKNKESVVILVYQAIPWGF